MRFECNRDECSDFNLISTREWLEINSNGCYAASTICGMNVRRQHGLLVVPTNVNDQVSVILSKFEESIFIENRVYELSTNQFTGGVYPEGYRHLIQFSLNPFPRFIFEIENRRIEKTILLLHDQNTLIIRYTLKNQGNPVKLVLKPIIAGRDAQELTKDIQGVNTDSYIDDGVVKLAPRPHLPELSIFFNKGEYVPAPLWYHNYTYPADKIFQNDERIDEDLFNPGFFTHELEPYDSYDLYISTEQVYNFDYEEIYRKEKAYRLQIRKEVSGLPEYVREISRKMEIMHIRGNANQTLSLPTLFWGDINLREFLLSLLGVMVNEKNYSEVKQNIVFLLSRMQDGLLPLQYRKNTSAVSYQAADCSLELINLSYFLFKKIKDLNFVEEKLYEPFRQIIEAFQKGTHYNIYMDKDGLIFSGDKQLAISWMPVLNDNGKVIRYGKLSEINALWYNALKIMELYSQQLDKKRMMKKYANMAKKTKENFLAKFWNKKRKIFYDFIRDDFSDDSLRLSQVLLLALPFIMPDKEQGKFLLRHIKEELLTPYGLRTLSPKAGNYRAHGSTVITRSDPEYYNGVVWPWSIGVYVDAVLHVKDKNSKTLKELHKLLGNFSKLYYDGCLGYLPEVLDGEEPFTVRGATAHSLAMAELFRSYFTLDALEQNLRETD